MLKHRQTRGKPTGKHLAATVAAFGMLLLTFLLTSQSAFAAGPALSASKTSGIAAGGVLYVRRREV